MEFLSSLLTQFSFDWESFLKIAAVFIIATLSLGFIGRGIFGKRSNLNLAVSSAVGILFIYIITIVVMTFGGELERLKPFLTPLPFVDIGGDQLQVFNLAEASHPDLCSNVLSMIILAFLVNLLDALLPRGENVLSWFVSRCMTVVLSMLAHFALTSLLGSFLPEVIMINAPMILLWILIIMLSVGALRLFVGAALATVNPIIGILYTFFFASIVGKQLSKAVLTTGLLTALVWTVNQLGITVLTLNTAAMSAYLPFLGILALIWYVLNCLL